MIPDLKYRVVHYTSVGTSIPRNYLRLAAQCAANPSFCPEWLSQEDAAHDVDLLDACLSVPPGAPREYECLQALSSWSSLHERILSYVRSDPRRASAELNAAMPWLSTPEKYGDRVYLYATETGAGQLAALVLKRFLEDTVYRGDTGRVDLHIISGFHEGLIHGLRSLSQRLAEDIRAEKTRDRSTLHLLNLTGGFKVEAAYLMLAGLREADMRGFALYIHEAQRKPMIAPLALALPIKVGEEELLGGLKELERGRPVSVSRAGELVKIIAYIVEPLELSRLEGDLLFLNREAVELLQLLAGRER